MRALSDDDAFGLKEILQEVSVDQHDESAPALPEEFIEAAVGFVRSEEFTQFMETNRSKFWILDAHPYYFAQMARFSSRPFSYTDEDFIFARVWLRRRLANHLA